MECWNASRVRITMRIPPDPPLAKEDRGVLVGVNSTVFMAVRK